MLLKTTLSLFCCLLQRVVAQVDISGCCTHIKIETTGEASIHQGNRIGEYQLTGVLAERPIYKNLDRDEFLFYLQSKNKGLWMVGPTAGQFNGGLAHRGDTYCVEDVPANQWKYTDGSSWHVDPNLRVSCLDQTVTPQCMYNDQTEFVGGDLPEVFGGGGVETSMESSADCIEECEKRSGCKYWTWVMGEKVNCYLKNSKVETVRKPKYVSGSIPKACTSTPPTATTPPATYSVCTYDNLDFQGGDLFTVVAEDVDDCRQQCEEHVSCQLFTFDKQLERGCYFKTDQVRVIANKNVVSGATAEICKDFILPHVTQKNEEPKYNKNEVNGKFKITSLRWDEKLNDPNSQEYEDLSNTIEDSLESMLRSERDLDEQAEFSVEVKKFRKGSVVCDFKVNYILKEAYIAIPFAIKPSNITDAMNKNFKFKKGILFQRFLIAAGSFNSSSPVDHCAAKGCSHKCDYDYDIEDYLCTCPRSLQLDNAGLRCITPEEAATEKTLDEESVDTTTIQDTASDVTDEAEERDDAEDRDESEESDKAEETSLSIDATEDATTLTPEVKLTLLPMNCLWSPWSDWTECSTSCGAGKKERQRSVVLPEKNGGFCPGRFKEFVECDGIDCEENARESEAKTDEAVTEIIRDNANENEQEILKDDGESMDDFGRKITTESTEVDVETDSPVDVSGAEVTTETLPEVISDETTNIPEKESTTTNNIIDVTTTTSKDINDSVDKDLGEKDDDEEEDEDTKIVFPLTEDDEISTTAATDVDILPTETPVLSIDVPLEETVEVQTEVTEKVTTDMPEIETVEEEKTDVKEQMTTVKTETEKVAEKNASEDSGISETTTQSVKQMDEMEDETTRDVSEFETTTQKLNTTEDGDMDVDTEKETDGRSSESEITTQKDIENEDMEIEVDIQKSMEENVDETTTQMEEINDAPLTVEDSSESETTTIKQAMEIITDSESDDDDDDIDEDDIVVKNSESETTTQEESVTELETTTAFEKELDAISTSETTTLQTNEQENDEEEKGSGSQSETTTVVNNTGEEVDAKDNTDEATKTNNDTDAVTESTPSEETTTVVDTMDVDATDKAPRLDTENEVQTVINVVTEVAVVTDKASVTTLNPNLDEAVTKATTVTVISIEESDGEVTIVTTAKPSSVTDMDTVNEDTTNKENDEATTEKTEEIETTSLNDIVIATDPEETVDDEIDTTTKSPDVDDHEFICKGAVADNEENADVPLECVLTNGEEEVTVFIVIPGDALSGDREKLFDKNVKIVVKDFMIMERRPRTLT